MAEFWKSKARADQLLKKAQKLGTGADLESVGIELEWLTVYARIARRFRDDKDFGLSRYPYEQSSAVGAFQGGFFGHREWPERRAMERFASLRPLYEYEAHYINAVGYWITFHQAAISLREETMSDGPTEAQNDQVERYDVWAIVAIRYGLRVTGPRVEFYRRSSKDPMHARLLMPVLEGKNEISATDDLDATLDKLDTHMATQLMKAVASLSASNAVKRGGSDGAAGSS